MDNQIGITVEKVELLLYFECFIVLSDEFDYNSIKCVIKKFRVTELYVRWTDDDVVIAVPNKKIIKYNNTVTVLNLYSTLNIFCKGFFGNRAIVKIPSSFDWSP